MRRLLSFIQVTVDGRYAGVNGDLGWAHSPSQDEEWNAFVAGNASSGGELLFGRVTYEMMVSYWPTPEAARNDPIVAEQMNSLPKVVFSRTLAAESWKNTKLVKADLGGTVRRMKQEPGPDLVILGSGTLVSQLAQAGLIDEYQVVINPVALGSGKSLFEGLKTKLDLKMTKTRCFANGNVLLCYKPRR